MTINTTILGFIKKKNLTNPSAAGAQVQLCTVTVQHFSFGVPLCQKVTEEKEKEPLAGCQMSS